MKKAIKDHARDFAAMIVLAVIAIAVGGYILANQRLRFPVVEEKPHVIKAEFSTAQAVTPGQGQTVRVSGVKIGDVGKVELKEGRAIVEMQILPKYRTLVRDDAQALLRPKTALKDMFIEVTPGDGRALKKGETIPVANTEPDVNPDEIWGMLDDDTRDYLRLLLTGAGGGLERRGGDLREVFRRLGPLHRHLAELNGKLKERRRELARLIHNYGSTVTELGTRDRELSTLVEAQSQALERWSSEDANISEAVRRLPTTLRTVQSALVKVNELGQALPPGLNAMRPVVRQLHQTNLQVRPFAR